MDLLRFIYYLGIIHLIFGFVWKWVAVLPTSLFFALIRFDKGVWIIKSVGAYFLVSVTAILALTATQEKELLLSIIYYLIGGFALFIGFTSNTYEAQKQAAQTYDYEMMDSLKYDTYITIGSLILFIIIGFIPSISVNYLTISFFELTDWVLDIKIIGWLVGIGGVLFLLNMFWYGLISSGLMIASIISIFRKKNLKNQLIMKK
ncbi:hypothetical protein KKF86_01790 [bacterium]|nr:hypothetical protein [bacterium]